MNDEILKQKIDFAMKAIDAEDNDFANVRGVIERMILAGYDLHATCDPLGYDD